MHFMKLITSKHLGALHFVDDNMHPKSVRLTIKKVGLGKTPGSKRDAEPRAEFFFEETNKSAFLSNSQIKKIANESMLANSDHWIGIVLEMTCGAVKDPRTGGQTMGMIVRSVSVPGKGERVKVAPEESRLADVAPENIEEEPVE